MKVQQIFAHDQDLGSGDGPVIFHGLHQADSLFKGLLHFSDSALFRGVDQHIHGPLKGLIRAALHFFIGAHLPQQVLQGIDHGQGNTDLDIGTQARLETGMKIVVVLIVISDDRDIRMACIVQGLSQKGRIVGQAAAPDVLAHHDRFFLSFIFGLLQGFQGFSNDDLGGEADIVVDIAFAQLDRAFPPDGKGHGLYVRAVKHCRHQTAEGMGGIGDENDIFPALHVLLPEFLRIGIRELPDLAGQSGPADRRGPAHLGELLLLGRKYSVLLLSLPGGGVGIALSLHPDRGQEGPDPDGQGPPDIALVHLQDQGRLAGDLLHDPDDLIGQIGVMAAAETDDLDIFEIFMAGGIDR